MKKKRRAMSLAAGAMVALAVGFPAHGDVVQWNSTFPKTDTDFLRSGTGNFVWSDTASWIGGIAPDQAGASVSVEVGGAYTITVDGDYTVGNLYSRTDGATPYFIGTGKLIFDNGPLGSVWQLHRSGVRLPPLRAGFTVDVEAKSDLTFITGAGRQDGDAMKLGGVLSGEGHITLALSSYDTSDARFYQLGLNGANLHSGGTTIKHVTGVEGLPELVYNEETDEFAPVGDYGWGRIQLATQSIGAFGTGDVTLDATGAPTGGQVGGAGAGKGLWVRLNQNSAMAPTAVLNLVSADMIALELMSGTSQTVSGIVVDGSPLALGTYTGGDQGWLFGEGSITVIPEPGTIALLGFASLVLMLRRGRRRLRG